MPFSLSPFPFAPGKMDQWPHPLFFKALLILIVVYNVLSLKTHGSPRVTTVQYRKALQFQYKTSLLLRFSAMGRFFLAITHSGLPILPISRDFFFHHYSLFSKPLAYQITFLLIPTGNGIFLLLYYLNQFGLICISLSHPAYVLRLPSYYWKGPSTSLEPNSMSAIYVNSF